MVQRLARGPFKAKMRVRFPLALPKSRAGYPFTLNAPNEACTPRDTVLTLRAVASRLRHSSPWLRRRITPASRSPRCFGGRVARWRLGARVIIDCQAGFFVHAPKSE